MTLTEFKNTAPQTGQLSMLKDNLDQVAAITIHHTDCSFKVYNDSLANLTGLTIKLNGDITVTVVSSQFYGSYYYFEVVPFTFSSTPQAGTCVDISLTPLLENTSIDFRNSDFYPLYNNVPENLTVEAIESIYKGKIEVRRGKNIYDVDRKNDAIKPTNLTNILNGNANLAEFPESNYTSFANTTGRYLGSKTSVIDYGVLPIINGTAFEGAQYPLTVNSGSICSATSTDRKTQNYIFTQPTGKSADSNDSTPNVSLKHLYWINGANATFTAYQTSITITQRLDISVGDILIVEDQKRSNGTNAIPILDYEYLKVTKVILTNSTTYLEFIRNYLNEYDSNSGGFTSASNGQFGLTKVIGSTIYNTDSSKIFKVVDKKLWIKETENILIVDKTGYTIILEGNCSI